MKLPVQNDYRSQYIDFREAFYKYFNQLGWFHETGSFRFERIFHKMTPPKTSVYRCIVI